MKYFACIVLTIMMGCKISSQNEVSSVDLKTAIELPEEIVKIEKTDAEWKKELSKKAYYILRKAGTERAFTGKYWDNKKNGIYTCGGCGLPLFDSKTKFRSGTGWPSFYEPLKKEYIREDYDFHIGYRRTEVLCARCDGHLGHVFPDGPKPTGLRYCINSDALGFVELAKDAEVK